MTTETPQARVRCRQIATEDLPAVAALLHKGFPRRAESCWSNGLQHLGARDVPEGLPRFGYCLDDGGRIAGVILLIASTRLVDGAPVPFINVASWYVEEAYRIYAQWLVSIALRNKQATYMNVTPAPHTWPIVEKQGYTRYCEGLFFAAAILKSPAKGVKVSAFAEVAGEDSVRAMPEFAMLERHHKLGCTVLVVEEGGTRTGYVFARHCVMSGRLPLPAMLVIHGPDREELVRIAGNLARHLMRHAAPFLVLDANGPVHGLAGKFTARRGRKYFKGPHAPALCDLADTEFTTFGV